MSPANSPSTARTLRGRSAAPTAASLYQAVRSRPGGLDDVTDFGRSDAAVEAYEVAYAKSEASNEFHTVNTKWDLSNHVDWDCASMRANPFVAVEVLAMIHYLQRLSAGRRLPQRFALASMTPSMFNEYTVGGHCTRSSAAERPDCPADLLDALARDETVLVRRSAYKNPNIDPDVIADAITHETTAQNRSTALRAQIKGVLDGLPGFSNSLKRALVASVDGPLGPDELDELAVLGTYEAQRCAVQILDAHRKAWGNSGIRLTTEDLAFVVSTICDTALDAPSRQAIMAVAESQPRFPADATRAAQRSLSAGRSDGDHDR